EHDIEFIEVVGQSTHFDMIAPADDHGMKSLTNHSGDRAMSRMNQRASGFEDVEAAFANGLHGSLRRAVGRDHHGWGGNARQILLEPDPTLLQIGEDRFVVHEVTENCDRSAFTLDEGEINGVANAETHAQMGGTNNFHTKLLLAKTLTRSSLC